MQSLTMEWLVMVCVCIGLSGAVKIPVEDIDIVTVREVEKDPTVRSLQRHPLTLHYEFATPQKKFQIQLRRNDKIRVIDKPIGFLQQDGTLREFGEDVKRRWFEDFAVYQSNQHTASFGIRSKMTDSGYKRELSGLFMDEDWVYELNRLAGDLYVSTRQPKKFTDVREQRPLPGLFDAEVSEDIEEVPDFVREIKNVPLPPPKPWPTEKKEVKRSHFSLSTDISRLLSKLNINMDRRNQGEKLEKKQSFCSPYINAGVELLSLVDDTLMRKFRRENSYNESVAWQKMTEYFAFVVNGVDLLYQNIQDNSLNIYVVWAGIVLKDSTWYSVSTGSCNDDGCMSEVGPALTEFRSFLSSSQASSLPHYDHVMSFTKNDLAQKVKDADGNLVWSDSVAGYAPVGGICSSSSSCSLVEAHGAFSSIGTAAHELGHNLGSDHDSKSDQRCTPSHNYIMAPSGGKENQKNTFFFSPCSIEQFRYTLKYDGCCLKKTAQTTIEKNSTFQNHVQNLPGQLYNITQQCQSLYGLDTTACNSYTTCTQLACTGNSFYCRHVYGHPPARGSEIAACDGSSFCINGNCVAKSSVSSWSSGSVEKESAWCADSNCRNTESLFTCDDWKAKGYCEEGSRYREYVTHRCCATCSTSENCDVTSSSSSTSTTSTSAPSSSTTTVPSTTTTPSTTPAPSTTTSPSTTSPSTTTAPSTTTTSSTTTTPSTTPAPSTTTSPSTTTVPSTTTTPSTTSTVATTSTTSGTKVTCDDLKSSCSYWKRQGYCNSASRYSTYVNKYCCKSCQAESWSAWSSWSACDKNCDLGFQSRTRTRIASGIKYTSTQKKRCIVEPCFGCVDSTSYASKCPRWDSYCDVERYKLFLTQNCCGSCKDYRDLRMTRFLLQKGP